MTPDKIKNLFADFEEEIKSASREIDDLKDNLTNADDSFDTLSNKLDNLKDHLLDAMEEQESINFTRLKEAVAIINRFIVDTEKKEEEI
jgi:septal ring factor EnvC (AmiA/AmiB activator)